MEDTHTYTHTCSVIHLLQRERVQTSKAMSALSDSIKLVQREGEASRRHLSDVLHAEVTIRYSLPCCVLQVSCCWNQPLVWCGVVWCGVVWCVCCRQRELDALQSAMTELGRHVTEETGAVTSGQQELEVAQAALRERVSAGQRGLVTIRPWVRVYRTGI